MIKIIKFSWVFQVQNFSYASSILSKFYRKMPSNNTVANWASVRDVKSKKKQQNYVNYWKFERNFNDCDWQ
jgi:hypothetical protein